MEKEYIIVDANGNDILSKSIEAIKVCGHNILRQLLVKLIGVNKGRRVTFEIL